ncbi:hypothetical protein JAAARDRAFT_33987 [Jaapia argillacea MUCL 33604]|uniref:Uncharacterized protein n=1 Tax=Jaapia argillacea MUCL 33604 TaxID=933084 RepID=A0A067PZE8_9AGAM|nr:hypothetical protein JAAARDRAFT_33987 [Jaapia argillacea MUCL 33604]
MSKPMVAVAPRQRGLKDIVLYQQVEVRLQANMWVVGIIVGALEGLRKFAGMVYEVEYKTNHGFARDHFPVHDVRPCPPG